MILKKYKNKLKLEASLGRVATIRDVTLAKPGFSLQQMQNHQLMNGDESSASIEPRAKGRLNIVPAKGHGSCPKPLWPKDAVSCSGVMP